MPKQIQGLTEEQKTLEREFGVAFYITKDKKLGLKTNAKYNLFIKKQKQKREINNLASLSDQLNLLATNLNLVVDELVKTNPVLAKNPNIVQGKKVLTGIQDILNPKPIPKVI